MSALEEEIDRKWPLPDVPFIGTQECERLRAEYEAQRITYRQQHSVVPRDAC